jgi:hypothetical protein
MRSRTNGMGDFVDYEANELVVLAFAVEKDRLGF